MFLNGYMLPSMLVSAWCRPAEGFVESEIGRGYGTRAQQDPF